MATVTDSSQIAKSIDNLNVDTLSSKTQEEEGAEGHNIKYGLPLLDVYRLAVSFYKGIV